MKRRLTARQAAALARHYYTKGTKARTERIRRIRSGEPTSGQEVNFYAGLHYAYVNLARLLTGRKAYEL